MRIEASILFKEFCLLFQHNSLMLLNAYYSQNYASIMCQGLNSRQLHVMTWNWAVERSPGLEQPLVVMSEATLCAVLSEVMQQVIVSETTKWLRITLYFSALKFLTPYIWDC